MTVLRRVEKRYTVIHLQTEISLSCEHVEVVETVIVFKTLGVGPVRDHGDICILPMYVT